MLLPMLLEGRLAAVVVVVLTVGNWKERDSERSPNRCRELSPTHFDCIYVPAQGPSYDCAIMGARWR
jgi:hypothetical protein